MEKKRYILLIVSCFLLNLKPHNIFAANVEISNLNSNETRLVSVSSDLSSIYIPFNIGDFLRIMWNGASLPSQSVQVIGPYFGQPTGTGAGADTSIEVYLNDELAKTESRDYAGSGSAYNGPFVYEFEVNDNNSKSITINSFIQTYGNYFITTWPAGQMLTRMYGSNSETLKFNLIPEPSSLSLVVAGWAVILATRRSQRSR